MGGALEAIKKGYMQSEIVRAAYGHQRAVDAGEQVIVGVNKYTVGEEETPRILEIDETAEKKQKERLARLRRERDNRKVKQALDKVHQAAGTDENIMPAAIEAVKTYATVGEISDVLRDVFGEYREPSLL
jgi:methylmalonyl-CoA mutase N-terminal domain/subunit